MGRPCLHRRDGRDEPTAVWHRLCLMKRTTLILLGSRRLRINWTREGRNVVRHQNSVFHGLLKHIPWGELDRLFEKNKAQPGEGGLTSREHLIAMLYGQLCGARSLREIETSLRSHA